MNGCFSVTLSVTKCTLVRQNLKRLSARQYMETDFLGCYMYRTKVTERCLLPNEVAYLFYTQVGDCFNKSDLTQYQLSQVMEINKSTIVLHLYIYSSLYHVLVNFSHGGPFWVLILRMRKFIAFLNFILEKGSSSSSCTTTKIFI